VLLVDPADGGAGPQMSGRRCEAIRVGVNVRCDNAGWIQRDGRFVCGVHKWSKNPRYIEKPGKIDPCSVFSTETPSESD